MQREEGIGIDSEHKLVRAKVRKTYEASFCPSPVSTTLQRQLVRVPEIDDAFASIKDGRIFSETLTHT